MNGAAARVLLVEDDPVAAGSIEVALADAWGSPFHVERVTRLSAALDRIASETFEVVLLDLSLPDGRGVEIFHQVFLAAPDAIILILATASDEETARLAVQRGAHDYLVIGHVGTHWLPRTLCYLMERKTTGDALRRSEALFRAMSDASPLGIFVSDAQGGCVYTNAAYQKISGLAFEQTLGTNWSAAIHPDDRERVIAEWCGAALSQEPFQTEFRFLQKDGRIVWTRINSAAIGDGTKAQGRVKTVEDITERKSAESVLRAAEEALFDERERARVTLNSIGDAVLSTDLQGNVTYLNLVAERMTGWDRQDALGQPLAAVFRIISGTTRQVAANPAQQAITEDKAVELAADCVLVRRDGLELGIEDSAAPIHNRDGKVVGAVIVFHDVSESRAMALKMSHLAQHDFLTDLPNRVLLTERISQAFGLARRNHKQVALLFVDLDHFKQINDSLGHSIGDQLLQLVADRLTACVRATDSVCRQGGDEFVILLAEIAQPQDTTLVAEKLLAAFAAPHLIGEHELQVTLSIGISVFPDDGSNVESVMRNADTAMYHAKALGRNNYQFFRTQMSAGAVRRQVIESSLRRAMAKKEFLLHYQPQIDLASGALSGAEALIRWLDPDHGLVFPMEFLPIAEECGLIVPIGRWALREACRQVKVWLESGLTAVPVAVNISAVEFRHKDFLEGIALILKETGLPPSYLELELTEGILMNHTGSAVQLDALKVMGVRIAIDDFGTGYSSLSHLKRFPIDTLKVDQSFVREIASDVDSATIVNTAIEMSRSLGYRVIAVGVETQDQLTFLQTRKCDGGQGFLFSHPLSAEEFELFLAAGKRDVRQRLCG